METYTDREPLTPTEAQFLLEDLVQKGVPLDHPDGARVWEIGNSCVQKLQAIIASEVQDGLEQ